ncbi:hypothetical protein GCM10010205_50230 [Streptomyces nojiriensis]|nr:hypothetical protein GCM10010205_50230 [Streptomyces nojiriensis]
MSPPELQAVSVRAAASRTAAAAERRYIGRLPYSRGCAAGPGHREPDPARRQAVVSVVVAYFAPKVRTSCGVPSAAVASEDQIHSGSVPVLVRPRP